LADFALSDVNPIPLDEKWLERCGFVENGLSGGYKYFEHTELKGTYRLITHISKQGEMICGLSMRTFNDDGTESFSYTPNHKGKFKHLHWLQNMFYFIAGNELTIL
jgi:hypothetical protein